MIIKKAVFPVAGLGTRFLPVTKAIPKEMLPLASKPLIQHVVEEAVAAGITELVFIISRTKQAIIEHFGNSDGLERVLADRNEQMKLQMIRNILPPGVSCIFLYQSAPLGLGHAILCARPVLGDAPFAVLLPDDIIRSDEENVLQQMLHVWQDRSASGSSLVAVQQVPAEDIEQYGIVQFAAGEPGEKERRLCGIVEKPTAQQAPSHWAVVGRYIFSADIFHHLAATVADRRGELQLTDAIAALIEETSVYAFPFQAQRYDCGSPLGYIQATLDYALHDPALSAPLRAYLSTQVGG